MENSIISLSLLFAFLSLFSLSSSTSFNEDIQLARSNLPSVQASKFIRDLNLFPRNDVNVIADQNSLPQPKKIVEKRFAFPNLVGSGVSVEDLGHHAGYYNIEHSHAARSIL
jgi:serine carboxypeptidase-like clade 4